MGRKQNTAVVGVERVGAIHYWGLPLALPLLLRGHTRARRRSTSRTVNDKTRFVDLAQCDQALN